MRDSPRRFPIAVLLPGFLCAALLGCGDMDEWSPLEEGVAAQAVGVIDFPSTTQGDFVPGVLLLTQGYALPAPQLQAVLDQRLPGSEALEISEDRFQARVAVPAGMDLKTAARILAQEPTFTHVVVIPVPNQASVAATLVETVHGRFVDDSPRLTYLAAELPSDLVRHAFGTVVRVSGRLAPPATQPGPETLLQVSEIEELAPYVLTLSGTFRFLGSGRGCPVLVPDQGAPIQLAGEKAEELASTSGAVGARFEVTLRDAGLSVYACSGGRRALLLGFTRR